MTIEQFAEEYPGYFPSAVYLALGKTPFDDNGRNRIGALPCILSIPDGSAKNAKRRRLLFWPPPVFALRFPGKDSMEGHALMMEQYAGAIVEDIKAPVAPTHNVAPITQASVEYLELGRWSHDAQPAPDRLHAHQYLDEALAAGRAEYGKAAIKRFWVRSENGDGTGGYFACRPGYGLFTTAHVDCWLQRDGNWREDYRRVQFGQKVEDQDE